MNLLNKVFILLSIFLSSCSWSSKFTSNITCENYFWLTNDFKNKYPEQSDYRLFIKNSFYETFNNDQKCHYYLEYANGTIIEDWGTYTMNKYQFYMSFPNVGLKTPVFCLYNSPTVDYHIIDELEYDGFCYHIIYQAEYLSSARG